MKYEANCISKKLRNYWLSQAPYGRTVGQVLTAKEVKDKAETACNIEGHVKEKCINRNLPNQYNTHATQEGLIKKELS